jgi:hypothetical protein
MPNSATSCAPPPVLQHSAFFTGRPIASRRTGMTMIPSETPPEVEQSMCRWFRIEAGVSEVLPQLLMDLRNGGDERPAALGAR